jgi:hypothetical protein
MICRENTRTATSFFVLVAEQGVFYGTAVVLCDVMETDVLVLLR